MVLVKRESLDDYEDSLEDTETESLKVIWSKLGLNDIFKDCIIIIDTEYLDDFLSSSEFRLTAKDIHIHKNDILFSSTLEIKESFKNYVTLNKMAEEVELHILDDHTRKRKSLLPLERYANTLSVNTRYEGMAGHNYFTPSFIISPLKSRNEYDVLIKERDNIALVNKRASMLEIIKRSYLKRLIPDKLLNFVLDNSASEYKENLTKENILNSYTELIADMILLNIDGQLRKYFERNDLPF